MVKFSKKTLVIILSVIAVIGSISTGVYSIYINTPEVKALLMIDRITHMDKSETSFSIRGNASESDNIEAEVKGDLFMDRTGKDDYLKLQSSVIFKSGNNKQSEDLDFIITKDYKVFSNTFGIFDTDLSTFDTKGIIKDFITKPKPSKRKKTDSVADLQKFLLKGWTPPDLNATGNRVSTDLTKSDLLKLSREIEENIRKNPSKYRELCVKNGVDPGVIDFQIEQAKNSEMSERLKTTLETFDQFDCKIYLEKFSSYIELSFEFNGESTFNFDIVIEFKTKFHNK